MRLVWTWTAALLTTLLLQAGPIGCGPGASNDADVPTMTSRVTAGSNPTMAAQAAGSAQGEAAHASTSQPAPSASVAQPVTIPDWMESALRHPDPQVRLSALDRWAASAPVGLVDPLLRALELLEADWARAQEGERYVRGER